MIKTFILRYKTRLALLIALEVSCWYLIKDIKIFLAMNFILIVEKILDDIRLKSNGG